MASQRPNSGEKRAHRVSYAYGGQFRERTVKNTRLEDENQLEHFYSLGRTLGRGSFGVVKEAVELSSSVKWAVKIITKERAGSVAMQLLEREVLILKRVDHAHIIRLEEVFETSKKMFLVMELCDQGELKEVLLKKGHLTEDETRIVMKKLASAVAYMHDHDLVHRDLKLENILLSGCQPDDSLNIKITDFGLSYVKGGTGLDVNMMQSKCGTPLYMAPEVLKHDYSEKCDVWSMGMIMYILLCGVSKQILDDSKLFEQIRQGNLQFPGSRGKELSSAAKSLIGEMLKVNPADRVSAKEILDHPWIAGSDDAAHKRPTVIDLMKEFRQEKEEQANMVSNDTINRSGSKQEKENYKDEESDRATNADQLKAAKTSRPRPKSATAQQTNSPSKSTGSPKPRMQSMSDLRTVSCSGSRSSPGPSTGHAITGSKALPGYMQPTKSSSHAVEAAKHRRERDHTHKS